MINSILTKVEKPTILLVGTHSDRISEEALRKFFKVLSHLIHQSFGQVIRAYLGITCVDGQQGIQVLLDIIEKLSSQKSLQVKAPPFLKLRGELLRNLNQKLILILRFSQTSYVEHRIQSVAEQSGIVSTKNLLHESLKAMHDIGMIVMLQDIKKDMKPVVVVRPSWLTGLLAGIVSTHRVYVREDGMLQKEYLAKVWGDHSLYPPDRHNEMVGLLRELESFSQ